MNKLSNKLPNKPSYRRARRPAGVTSLLFVLAISLVLIVMVGGIAALTVREQQQASNTELSNRALQTAEAGVKAAVVKLSADSAYSKADCGSAEDNTAFLDFSTDQSITCATVTSLFTTTYEGYLEVDRTTQFIYDPAAEADSLYRLKLSWNAPSLGDPAAAALGGTLYPDAGAAYENAAMVEMNIVYWLKSGATATSFKNATLLFAPGNNSNTNNPISNSCTTADGIYSCTTADGSATLKGFSIATATGILVANVGNYNYAIRITPRYKGTHFALTGYKTGGINIASAQSNKAQIDITAKVGNLYRRVKAEKIITPSAIETIGTSVLYAGRGSSDASSYGICKTGGIYTTSSTTALIGTLAAGGNFGPDCP